MTSVPPGWYQDPWAQSAQRWWDGSAWTGHTYPPAYEVAAAAPKKRRVIGSVEFIVTVASILLVALVVIVGGSFFAATSQRSAIQPQQQQSTTPARPNNGTIYAPAGMQNYTAGEPALLTSAAQYAREKSTIDTDLSVPKGCEELWMQSPVSSLDKTSTNKLTRLANFANSSMRVTAVARRFATQDAVFNHISEVRQEINRCGASYTTKYGDVQMTSRPDVAFTQPSRGPRWAEQFTSGTDANHLVDVVDIYNGVTVVRATCIEDDETDADLPVCNQWFTQMSTYVANAPN